MWTKTRSKATINHVNHVKRQKVFVDDKWSSTFYNCLQISSETAVCYHTDNWPLEATCKEEEERSWQAFIVSFPNTTHLNWKNVCYELFNVSKKVLKRGFIFTFHPEANVFALVFLDV